MSWTAAQVARIVGCELQQIKSWAWTFKEALSLSANPGKGQARFFIDSDVRALAYICTRWEDNPDLGAIKIGLEDTDYLEAEFRELMYPWMPILQEPPSELDETWRHGILFVGSNAQQSFELARNYRHAADILLKAALDGNSAFDGAPPIVFLFRHALELYLKMLGDVKEPTHSLAKCLAAVERRTKSKVGRPWRGWILELDEMDPTSTVFRYADEIGGYVEYWVDFCHLRFAMAGVFDKIDHAVLAYTRERKST